MRNLVVAHQLPIIISTNTATQSSKKTKVQFNHDFKPKLNLRIVSDRKDDAVLLHSESDVHLPGENQSYVHIQGHEASSSSFDSMSSDRSLDIKPNMEHELWCSLQGVIEDRDIIWFGMPPGGTKLTSEAIETLRTHHRCIVVEDRVNAAGFSKYCRRILEPILHNMLPDYHLANYSSSYWTAYVQYNQAFADSIIQEYRDDDVIWINDFYFLLVPRMIRSVFKNARIGFFLHVPFPTSEIFRCLPSRAMILEGILAADLIGFQTPSFSHHFLHSCTRILGLEPTSRGIQVEDERFANITVSPLGINPSLLRDQLYSPTTMEIAKNLKERFTDRKIIVGCDRSGLLGGIKQKLLAIESLLTNYPHWQGKLSLIQIVKKSGPRDKVYDSLVALASGINRRFGSFQYSPIIISTDYSPSHTYALLQIADLCLITSLSDGMNLMAHKFILAQERSHGPVIISEFSGAALIFDAAIRINPWNSLDVGDLINETLELDPEERKARHSNLLHRVLSSTAQDWANFFLSELLRVTNEAHQKQLIVVPALDEFRLKSSFKFSQKPMFILDYDALIPSFRNISQSLTSISSLRSALLRLTANQNYTIILISGRSAEQMEHTIGELPIIMCVEDGFSYRNKLGVWMDLLSIPDFWPKLSSILDYWTERTPGAWLESKRASFIWHYGAAGEFGARQAKECHAHIQDAIGSNYPVYVVASTGKLQIRLRMLSQRQALSAMFDKYIDHTFDFIGVFLRPRDGDDLFEYCSDYFCCTDSIASRRAEYIVSIGKIDSTAVPWHIADAHSLIKLLNCL